MSYGFTSGFAKDLEDMIALKATFGFSEATYLDRAKDFDRHCSSGHPDADRVTEPIVISWLKAGMSKADGTVHRKAAFARAFGRYQRSTGKDAYVISEMFTAGKSIFVPYIFSDDELKGLFHEIDLYEKAGRELEAALLSTYFRLTYTCGLRPNEGRLLKRSEVDLGSGEVRIVNTKWHKSRKEGFGGIVPVEGQLHPLRVRAPQPEHGAGLGAHRAQVVAVVQVFSIKPFAISDSRGAFHRASPLIVVIWRRRRDWLRASSAVSVERPSFQALPSRVEAPGNIRRIPVTAVWPGGNLPRPACPAVNAGLHFTTNPGRTQTLLRASWRKSRESLGAQGYGEGTGNNWQFTSKKKLQILEIFLAMWRKLWYFSDKGKFGSSIPRSINGKER